MGEVVQKKKDLVKMSNRPDFFYCLKDKADIAILLAKLELIENLL